MVKSVRKFSRDCACHLTARLDCIPASTKADLGEERCCLNLSSFNLGYRPACTSLVTLIAYNSDTQLSGSTPWIMCVDSVANWKSDPLCARQLDVAAE